jgi:uncharacterized protein YuzE
MRIEFDRSVDAAYIYVQDGDTRVDETQEVRDGVVADFDAEGKLVGIEVLNASKNLPAGVVEQSSKDTLTA